jgi:beta-galactosidase
MFTVPADWKGEHISVEFEGVFHYSMIYLNGVLLTNHSCGYTSFDVELPAKLLNYGQPNTFAVYTDATSGTGWWYEGGGIFRHVWLVKRSPIHFATWGVFVAPSVHPGTVRSAVARGATIAAASPSGGELVGTVTLNVTATVVSTESAAAATVGAAIDVFDAVGSHVGSFSTENVSVVSGGEVSLHSLRPLPAEVNLWTIRAPALYTVRTRLLTTSGAVLDEVNTTTGFRLLRYDSSNGFQMNGEEVKVRGFCDHNDFGSVGTAVPDRINLYRAQAARSLGGNGRRTSHNPPNPSMLDIYDRVGMVVMAENRDFFAGDRYYENMADLVRRDRNHASVTIW